VGKVDKRGTGDGPGEAGRKARLTPAAGQLKGKHDSCSLPG